MKTIEADLRDIKDRIASALGVVNDSISDVESTENYQRLMQAAEQLHRCADEIQRILVRIKPK
ncbi:MAG: hypothetical protein QHI38_12980 [Armatimonadota bacterium]|nr:hypothetical protein [Armatimonadota bacterium]